MMNENTASAPAGTLDLSRLERSPGFLLRLAQLRIYDAFHTGMAEHGLTPTRYSILAVLHDNPLARPSQIADALRIKPSNMAPLLAQFEAEGLTERTSLATERRAVLIRLTPAGETLFAAVKAQVKTLEDESVAMLTPAERRTLLALLARVGQK